MNLQLKRKWFTDKSTIGELFIDINQWECFILEDVVREGPKIPGKTAIPEGVYRIIINHSQRFNRDLPLLLNVPGFEGIRIHPGNTDKDTEGCLLPGQTRSQDFVGSSRLAFDLLFSKLNTAFKAGLLIQISIANEGYQDKAQKEVMKNVS